MVAAWFNGRISRSLLLGSFLIGIAVATPARAHFVWIRSDVVDKDLVVKAGFGDPESWDAEFSDRIAGTTYFTRSPSGKEEALKLPFDKEAQSYIAQFPHTGPVAILGVCEYGTFSFGGKPFLLKYYAKRLSGAPETWSKLSGSERLAIEAVPSLLGKEIEVTVLAEGQPVPDTELKVYGPTSKGVAFKTDSAGKLRWPAEGAGEYALYVGRKLDGKGEHDGKPYDGIREYATLSFTLTTADLAPSASVDDSSRSGRTK